MKGLDEDLVQPHRSLILEEALRLDKRSSELVYFLLFTDILIVVDEVNPEIETTLNVRLVFKLQVKHGFYFLFIYLFFHKWWDAKNGEKKLAKFVRDHFE
jgi:hypothetical protein